MHVSFSGSSVPLSGSASRPPSRARTHTRTASRPQTAMQHNNKHEKHNQDNQHTQHKEEQWKLVWKGFTPHQPLTNTSVDVHACLSQHVVDPLAACSPPAPAHRPVTPYLGKQIHRDNLTEQDKHRWRTIFEDEQMSMYGDGRYSSSRPLSAGAVLSVPCRCSPCSPRPTPSPRPSPPRHSHISVNPQRVMRDPVDQYCYKIGTFTPPQPVPDPDACYFRNNNYTTSQFYYRANQRIAPGEGVALLTLKAGVEASPRTASAEAAESVAPLYSSFSGNREFHEPSYRHKGLTREQALRNKQHRVNLKQQTPIHIPKKNGSFIENHTANIYQQKLFKQSQTQASEEKESAPLASSSSSSVDVSSWLRSHNYSLDDDDPSGSAGVPHGACDHFLAGVAPDGGSVRPATGDNPSSPHIIKHQYEQLTKTFRPASAACRTATHAFISSAFSNTTSSRFLSSSSSSPSVTL